MSSRIFVASFPHETNTFVSENTTREMFRRRGEFFGDAVRENLEGTNTPVGGILRGLEDANLQAVPSVVVGVLAGGPVEADTYAFYADRIVEDLKEADDIDGVVLHLHGAMVTTDDHHGEAPLVERVRTAVGSDVPIAVSHDLHGNVSDRLLDAADVLVCFETYPHEDMGATGKTTVELLARTLRGDVRPTMHVERLPLYPSIPSQHTRDGPMADVMATARRLEERDGVLKVNVFPGFYGADVPENVFSIVTVTDDDSDLARSVGRELGERVWADRDVFLPDALDASDAVMRAEDMLEAGVDAPVVLAEVADNPGGGAPGDETTLLRELLTVSNWNVGFAIVNDQDAIEACIRAGVRERVTLDLGGSKPDTFSDPIADLEARIKAITDGRFVRTGPFATGSLSDFGRTVLLESGPQDNVAIVLTETRMQPSDAELWRHVGLPPERFDILALKSANHYRASYEPLASEVIPVDTPGVMPADPAKLPFENRPSSVYPIETLKDDAYPPNN
jgi:microcystin degradation protein MlrC